MGNVVSSLLMYALQAAWFCQRLIDQDYSQNHGSRSKPIMETDETDLDVFLSKCRSYYLSRKQIEYKESRGSEREKKKCGHHRSRSCVEEIRNDYNTLYKSQSFDSESFSSRIDKQLGRNDLARAIIDKNNLERLTSRSWEASKYCSTKKSESPKAERRRRKRVYYRKRYNPKSGPDRPIDIFNWEASRVTESNSDYYFRNEHIDSISLEDNFKFFDEGEGFPTEENPKEFSQRGTTREGECRDESESGKTALTINSFTQMEEGVQESEIIDHGLVLIIKNVDMKASGGDADKVFIGLKEKVPEMLKSA